VLQDNFRILNFASKQGLCHENQLMLADGSKRMNANLLVSCVSCAGAE